MNTARSRELDNAVTDALMTNEDESDELFSDDENKEINYRSDISLDNLVLRSKTPLSSIDNSVTPSNAIIPSTPLSLVPFLNKINEQWTSDLETPQTNKTIQLQTKPPTSGPTNAGETPKLEQHTPDTSTKNIDNKITSDSPVLVTRVVRKRPKRRRIFKFSTSIDTSADINNENTTVNGQEAATGCTNHVAQSNATNTVTSISDIDSAHEDNKLQDRIQEICDNEKVNELTDFVPDILDLAEELFNDASFSNINRSVINNLDKQVNDITAQDNSKQDIVNISRERSQTLNVNKVEEQENAGFFTARGTAINISKEALFKAKKLLADEMQMESCDLLGKKNSIEQKDKHLSLSSRVLPKSQFIKHSKSYSKVDKIKDTEQLFANENSDKKDSLLPFSHSTASAACSNVYEQTSSKIKLSFTEELNEFLEFNVAKKINIYNKENRLQEMKNSSIGFQTACGKPISISKQALFKAKLLFANELDENLEGNAAEKVDIQNEENRLCEIKNSNIAFQTAHGAPISISRQALSKAKLFAKELDESLESNVTEEVSTSNEAVAGQEIKTSSIGFRTARDVPINISKQALSRAKSLFAKELEEPSESNVTEEVNITNEAIKGQEIKAAGIGFQTARGAPINISKQALSKAKSLYTSELDELLEVNVLQETNISDKKVITPNIGFQTARGAPINISKQALSRAKSLFAKELEEPSESNVTEKASINNEAIKGQEIKAPGIGFQTVRGASINISKQILSKAKSPFAKKLDEPLEVNVVQETNISDKEVTTPNIGFQTARGTPVNVSKQALSRAKLLFAKEFDEELESNIAQRSDINNETVREQDTKVSSVRFRTARGATIGISEQAFSKAQALFTDQLNSPVESSLSEKRKLSSDDSTPLGRGFAFGWKKIRLSNEFEGRKLFSDFPSADTDNDDRETETPLARAASRMSIDDDDAEDGKIETLAGTKLSEVAASHMEPDEKNQEDLDANFLLHSPKRDNPELSEPDAMGSPVIGKQSAPRKRWSLEQRKSKHGVIQLDETTPSTMTASTLENAPAHHKKVDEEESRADFQRTTQADWQKTESNSESADYGDTQMMMDFIDESAQILQNRLEAALEQEKIITSKRRHRFKQSPGYLYRLKQANFKACISLRDLGKGAPLRPRTCQELIDQKIPPNILAICAATAASYKFRCSNFYGSDVARNNVHGLELLDGARLVMDENGYVGVWDFLRAFLASPGVDPNLVPARWIENHYRWIVWKLASMDRMKFGSTELPRALTPSNVMAQLKYRYDREIDQSQRPAIRRILEKDDVASKRMILCVSSVAENSAAVNSTAMEVGKSPRVGVLKWKIELTDGWYSIPACIDLGMLKNVSTGKMREGTKLLVHGAELLNCDEPCHPLEAKADVCLKLHTNSTRRARWDSKLGYASRSGPIPVKLRDVCPNGGFIGRMTIVIARTYPMLYHEKSTSGESVIRNAKSEEKAQIEYEQRCRRKAEALYDKAEEDFQENFARETDLLAQSAKDRESSTQKFTDKKRQDELLRELRMKKERYKQELQSRLRESLPAPRQVSPLLKVRVCDGNANAILSVWSAGEEVVDALKEGACVSLRNITAAGKRGCELQLTAGRCALFNPGTMRDASYPARVCASFREVGSPEFSPPYGEFDTVGLVCAVGTAPYGMNDFEVAHLAYPKSDSDSSSSYLSIMFWQGIASYGYTEILTVGSIVACNNLEWRRATSWNVPVAYCTERSTFTRNPRRNHLYEAFENLRSSIADPIAYAEGCIAELNVELQKKSSTTMRTPTRYALDKNTPIKIYNSAAGSDKRPVDHTPLLLTPRSSSVNNSRSYSAASSAIQKRLDKLHCYAEPAELSPVVIRSSKRASLIYRSPVAVSTDTSSSVNTPGSSSNSCLSPQKQ